MTQIECHPIAVLHFPHAVGGRFLENMHIWTVCIAEDCVVISLLALIPVSPTFYLESYSGIKKTKNAYITNLLNIICQARSHKPMTINKRPILPSILHN